MYESYLTSTFILDYSKAYMIHLGDAVGMQGTLQNRSLLLQKKPLDIFKKVILK